VDRIEIAPLTQDDAKGVKWSGTATLYLDDDTAIALTVKRKLRKKKGTWKYKLKSLKRAKPKVRVSAELGGAPEQVLKFRLLFKGAAKVKLRDVTKVTLGDCGGGGPKPTTFTVGTAGGSFDAAGGKVSFFFPVGAVTDDTTITVTPIAPPANTEFIAGTMYEFEPDMSFLQPVDLTITYDDSGLTGDEADLRLAKFLEGDPAYGNQRMWVHSGVDTANNRVTGFITGFSGSGTRHIGPTNARPPAQFALDVNMDQSVTLTWISNSSAAVIIERTDARYDFRSPADGDFKQIRVASASAQTFTDSSTRGQNGIYYYRLRSLVNQTQSWPTHYERAAIVGTASPPRAVDSFTATAYACGGIELKWDWDPGDPNDPNDPKHEIGVTDIKIERKLAAAGDNTYVLVDDLPGAAYFHVDSTPLVPGTRYTYRITAINSHGPGGARTATVTSSASEFTVSLSGRNLWIPPGDSGGVTVTLHWMVASRPVTFSATTNSSRVTAAFSPSGTTEGSTDLVLAVDAAAPRGLRVNVTITADDGGGSPCAIPGLTLLVDDPPAPPASVTLTGTKYTSGAGGELLTLIGTGFVTYTTGNAGTSAVYIDGTEWPELWVVSDTQIEVYLYRPPFTAGRHKVKVVNPDGAETQELEFTAD
jgi:hypothetical protein